MQQKVHERSGINLQGFHRKQSAGDHCYGQQIEKGRHFSEIGISYHAPRMNAFNGTRLPTGRSVQQSMYNITFDCLVEQVVHLGYDPRYVYI